jgi:hypothetical protein
MDIKTEIIFGLDGNKRILLSEFVEILTHALEVHGDDASISYPGTTVETMNKLVIRSEK